MHFEDTLIVNAAVDKVWDFISTPSEFVRVIPDLQSKEILDDKTFQVSFKMGLGMIKGTINMKFAVESAEPGRHLKLAGRGSGLQSTSDLTIDLELSPQDGNTLVKWAADLEVTGTAASMGMRFIEPVTRSKVREIVDGVRKEFAPA